VKIEITSPKAGMSVRDYWVILHNDSLYSIDENASFWEYPVDESEETWKEITDGVFAPQTVYRASLLIYPVESEIFDSSTIVNINGNSVAYDLMEDGKIRVHFSFPKTDSSDSEVSPTGAPDDDKISDDEKKDAFPVAGVIAVVAIPLVLGAGGIALYLIRKKRI